MNETMTRRPEPYSVRSFCERCGQIDYVAKLVVPFWPPATLCRSCRVHLTGVPDTRNMREPIAATATIVEPPKLAAPRIAGLLMAGPPVMDESAVDAIFAPWNESVDDPELAAPVWPAEGDFVTEMEALERELDVVLGEIDRRLGGTP